LESIQPLLAVALVAASVACAVAVWALIEVARASSSARLLSDDTRERLIPLLDKVDVTVDAVNAECRVDAIITQVEGASARVSHASDAISGIEHTAEIVNERPRKTAKTDARREAAEEQAGRPRTSRATRHRSDSQAMKGCSVRLTPSPRPRAHPRPSRTPLIARQWRSSCLHHPSSTNDGVTTARDHHRRTRCPMT
jgi:hypothetical protein